MEEYTDEKLSEYFSEYLKKTDYESSTQDIVSYDDKGVLNVFLDNIDEKKYSDFLRKLTALGFKGRINFIYYKDEENNIFGKFSQHKEEKKNIPDEFLQCLEEFKQEIGIENISLEMDFEFTESKFLEQIQNIQIFDSLYLQDLNSFIVKFPNLKNIIIPNYKMKGDTVEIDLDNLNTLLKYVPYLIIRTQYSEEEIQSEINANKELKDKIIVLNHGKTFINLDKIQEYTGTICVCMEDIKERREQLDLFINLGYDIALSISDASELNIEQARNLSEIVKIVSIDSPKAETSKSSFYELSTYISIRSKLDELVEGISLDLSDEDKVAEIYTRICRSIVYDKRAVEKNAVTKEDKKYVKNVLDTSRNLENGLLYGKCVCAGYAEILRNALALVNVESLVARGSVRKELHAWNKIKINGTWYNFDVTWDASVISQGIIPQHFGCSDSRINIVDQKREFKSNETKKAACKKNIKSSKVKKLFESKGLSKLTMKEILMDFGIRLKSDMSEDLENIKKIWNLFIGRSKSLPEPTVTEKKKTEDKEVQTWDLEKFGTSKEDFDKKVKANNQRYLVSLEPNKKEENYKIDGR